MSAFLQGGPSFNFWSLVISGAGSVVTILALAVAVWQIRKTLTAAEAARGAAEETQQQIQKIKLLIDLGELCSYCREILGYLREQNRSAAAVRLSDLRSGLARARSLPTAADLQSARKWQTMITQLSLAQDALSSDDTQDQIQLCTKTVSQVSDQLNSFVPHVERINGNPRTVQVDH